MTRAIIIERAGPLCSVQDCGRHGQLRHGISASGPMDAAGYEEAGRLAGATATSCVEFTTAGLAFTAEAGEMRAGCAGGDFNLSINGNPRAWPAALGLQVGDRVEIRPGSDGNYGYLRFDGEIDVPLVMGSRATNLTAGLGGLAGRTLQAGDRLALLATEPNGEAAPAAVPLLPGEAGEAIRFVWGLHADLFLPAVRTRFVTSEFRVSSRLDRMGARLEDRRRVFGRQQPLSLVSDAIVPGDIQILGDGTPIVLLRDHPPTGGYPRIATVITADLGRFAQLRPGSAVRFAPVTVDRAQRLMAGLR
jgi:5-oxoprolinase (ATP-hydrolysing) subunit C